MARLPSQKKIMREDIQDAPSWIDRLLYPINNFMENVYYALNKNITFQENIRCQIKDIDILTDSSGGVSGVTFTHSLGANVQAKGVLLLKIVNKSSSSYTVVTNATTIDWREINGSIEVNNITGLGNSTPYTISLLVI